jgi:N-acetylneuraminic acid mutarotase
VALSAALAMAGLTTAPAGAVTRQASTPATAGSATSNVPNVAPETSGTLSQVCSAPKTKGVASCLAIRVDKARSGFGVRLGTTAAPSGFGPSQLLSAYDLPGDGGEGATIAIVDAYDDPDAAADLAVYREQFGLPVLEPGQFRKVNQEGFPGDYPAGDPSWATEISLDLDMVSAIAPKADIILVEADGPTEASLGIAVNEAVALGASYVSNSYGGTDSAADPQLDAEYFDHPGVAIVASAGDSGYGVEFPAAAPDVTAVGGTTLSQAPGTTRGWTETAWSRTGSGCSAYEPKPGFQPDTGCAKRTVADVSADANPYTGVAVYDSYSDGGATYGQGWGQYGGTSVAAPVITATYALGGPIATGSHPNADPYKHAADLNDVTSGSNGTCSPSYLCTAGPGYDGPTGLGTPAGTGAFADTSYGVLTGKVTSTAGQPVAGAQLSITGSASVTTTTDADGTYQTRLPAGGYRISVTSYGYSASTADGVAIAVGATTVRSVKLTTEPRITVSGTVTDSSGHGWPVHSLVVLDYGTGTLETYTSPVTGRYSLRVPGESSYQVQVVPQISGYSTADVIVTLGAENTTRNIGVSADLLADEGSAPGYDQHTSGTAQTFTDGTLPSGWTLATAAGSPWSFLSAASLDASTGQAAVTDFTETPTDASLYTPAVSVPAGQSPLVSFTTSEFFGLAQVDITTDGGQTWQTEWSQGDVYNGQVEFTLPSAGEARSVQLRFRYQAYDSATSSGAWWFVRDVLLGTAWLSPRPGGLVEGHVTDANTGQGLDGVSVGVGGQPEAATASAAMAGLGADGDGFYYLFSADGRHTITGTLPNYGEGRARVDVAAGEVTVGEVVMPAGKVATSGNISATVSQDSTATGTLTLANTGNRAATVAINQFPGSGSENAAVLSQAVSRETEPTARAKTVAVTPGTGESLVQRLVAARHSAATAATAAGSAATAAATSSAPAWSALTDLPTATYEGVAGSYDGTAYEGLGANGLLATSNLLYSYDPATSAWQTQAGAPVAVAEAGYATIGDELYVTGGIGGSLATGLTVVTTTQVYDFATNTWSQVAADPYTIAGTDVALDGELYQIGGVSATTLSLSNIVSVYDPSTNTWSEVTSYPADIDNEACGAIAGTLYCAGGDVSSAAVSDAYAYTPGDTSWQQISALPIPLLGAAFSVADGELLVSGGETVAGSELTTAGYKYDPAMNWWVPLPPAATATFGAAGALGFYTFGGLAQASVVGEADVLTGYDQVDAVSLPWLSLSQHTISIQPGRKVTIEIGLNAAEAGLSGSGTVTAALGFETDTPYEVTPVAVSLTAR